MSNADGVDVMLLGDDAHRWWMYVLGVSKLLFYYEEEQKRKSTEEEVKSAEVVLM